MACIQDFDICLTSFPSPTGVDHYEYKMIEAFECDMALGFRPLQGLTIMNKTFDNLKHSFILFPSPTGVDHYEFKNDIVQTKYAESVSVPYRG